MDLRNVITVGIGLSATALIVYKLRSVLNRKAIPPSDWMKVGTLDEIIYFPLKSCTGIVLEEAFCGQFGIQEGNFHDRIFMLYEVTEKDIGFAGKRPKLYDIKTERIDDTIMKITAPGMEDLIVDLLEITECEPFEHLVDSEFTIPLMDCGPKFEKWFSKFVKNSDSGIKLVWSKKPINKEKWFQRTPKVNYIMVTTTSSLDDLNSRVANPVLNRQFRGNFLIKTDRPAYDEDNWRWMKIGDSVFQWNDYCFRCILPNINPYTCERSKDFEPFKTLKKYRIKAGKKEPIYGNYFDVFSQGLVKKGDEVYVSCSP